MSRIAIKCSGNSKLLYNYYPHGFPLAILDMGGEDEGGEGRFTYKAPYLPQCGRKTLLLLGAVVLGLSQALAAALIQIFDLENEGDLSVGRRVAGYLVIGLICLMMSMNNWSYGYIYVD